MIAIRHLSPRFMREHRWTHKHLSEYLDDELARPDRARVEKHVGRCPRCQRVLETLKRTIEGLRTLGAEPQPGVAEGVIRRLREP